MKKIKFILKHIAWYIIGFISFSIIAYITQSITISIWLDKLINPSQDIKNIINIIKIYGVYYLIAYTLLHTIICILIRKHDQKLVKKLNEKLEKVKKEN